MISQNALTLAKPSRLPAQGLMRTDDMAIYGGFDVCNGFKSQSPKFMKKI
jgi:hypothetical protein